jgi:hypothetical protein
MIVTKIKSNVDAHNIVDCDMSLPMEVPIEDVLAENVMTQGLFGLAEHRLQQLGPL